MKKYIPHINYQLLICCLSNTSIFATAYIISYSVHRFPNFITRKCVACDTRRARRVLPQATIFHSRRVASLAERFYFVRNAVSYKVKKALGYILRPPLVPNRFLILSLIIYRSFITSGRTSFIWSSMKPKSISL